jgi:hypothetical protein
MRSAWSFSCTGSADPPLPETISSLHGTCWPQRGRSSARAKAAAAHMARSLIHGYSRVLPWAIRSVAHHDLSPREPQRVALALGRELLRDRA